jgi:pentatricopeptide repeat protein
MMTKCCTGGDSFADCLKMMEEMKKQCCAPNKDVAESEGKKK